jgi:hypothetical protein
MDLHEVNTSRLWSTRCSCDDDDCTHTPNRSTKGRTPRPPDVNLPEDEILLMASTAVTLPNGWTSVRDAELELRKAQAYGCLSQIRLEIGHKSLLLRNNKNRGDGKKGRLRGYATIASCNRVINLYRTIYHRSRSALERLHAPSEVLTKLQWLQPDDIKPLIAVYLPNARDQRNKPVPWLWSVDVFGDTSNQTYLAESTSSFSHAIMIFLLQPC